MTGAPPSNNTAPKKKLLHVTGLRALAILGVLLFHCFKTDVPNGYLGVNVFLVITGYFLFASLWKGDFSFSLPEFCSKRLSRLFPPFLVVIAAALVLGVALYPPETLFKASRYAFFSLIGYSNYYFNDALEDYFADDSDSVMLLMTWYFSVLLQVYVFYAVAAYALKRFSLRVKVAVLAVVALASLAATYPVSGWPVLFGPGGGGAPAAYFSTVARLWMVLAGAFAVFLPEIRSAACRNTVHLISVAVVALMMFCQYRFPMQDVPAVAAAVLCVRYAPTGVAAFPMQNRMVCALGAISFSLYLVHWPLIVVARYIAGNSLSLPCYGGMAVLILILSILLWFLVEKRKFRLKTIIISWVVLAAVSVLLMVTHGLKGIPVHPAVTANETRLYTDFTPVPKAHPVMNLYPKKHLWKVFPGLGGKAKFPYKAEAMYFLGDPAKSPEFILMGDSHANALYAGFDVVAKEAGWCGVYPQAYVMPFENFYWDKIKRSSAWTREKAEDFICYLKAHPELHTVVLHEYWSKQMGWAYLDWSGKPVDVLKHPDSMAENLYRYVKRIKEEAGKQVVLITDVPTMPMDQFQEEVFKDLVLGRPVNYERYTVTRADYDELNAIPNAAFRKLEEAGLVTVLRSEDFFFRDGPFCGVSKTHGVLYIDSHHMGVDGVKPLVESFREQFSEILRKGAEAAK